MPLIWTNAAARDAHMTAENRRHHEERYRQPVQPPADHPGAGGPGRPLEPVTGQPGGPARARAESLGHASQADTPILDPADPDMTLAAEFSALRQRKGRARARGSDVTPARPTEGPRDFGPLADPELEQLAQRAANVEDQKQLWSELIKALKKRYPADEALRARDRVWARRKAIRAERRLVAKARQSNGAH